MALASTAAICKELSNQINHTQRMQLNSLDTCALDNLAISMEFYWKPIEPQMQC